MSPAAAPSAGETLHHTSSVTASSGPVFTGSPGDRPQLAGIFKTRFDGPVRRPVAVLQVEVGQPAIEDQHRSVAGIMLCFGKGFSLAVSPHGHASRQLAGGICGAALLLSRPASGVRHG
jgi:hypothetical protein